MNFEFELRGVRRRVNWLAVIPALVVILLVLGWLFGGGTKVVAQKPTPTSSPTPSLTPTGTSTATASPSPTPTLTATASPPPTFTATAEPKKTDIPALPTLEAQALDIGAEGDDSPDDSAAIETPPIQLPEASPTSVASGCTGGIVGRLREDANQNAAADADEVGVSSVTVQIYDGHASLVGSTLSGADGSYGFTGLRFGAYRVVITVPQGWRAERSDFPINLFGCGIYNGLDFFLSRKGN